MEFFKRVVALQGDELYEDYNDLVTRLREEHSLPQVSRSVNCNRSQTGSPYYKDKGFLLAQAFIPAQGENGNVLIEVIEGRLGNVLAQGNQVQRGNSVRT